MVISVDPRIELLMAVQSTTDWYVDEGPLGNLGFPYRDAAFALAKAQSNHPALTMWRDLAGTGFTFDAPVTFMLLHGPLPELMSPKEYGPYLASRAGGADRLAQFGPALGDFAAVSGFLNFLGEWRRLLDAFVAQACSVIDPAWPHILDAYAGRAPLELRVILAPLSAGNYGPTVDGASYSVVAPTWSAEGPRFDDPRRMRYLVLHEGAHSFVNPAVDAVGSEVAASSELLGPIRERMEQQAYSDWRITVCEHVVRAIVARLSQDPEAVLAKEEAKGFIYVRPVARVLAEEYEADRHFYPDLCSFAPRLAEVLRGLCRAR